MPLAHYLKDFSSPKPSSLVSEPMAFDIDGFGIDDDPMLELPQPEPIDIEAERMQAFEEGRMAATQQLSEQHADEIQRLEAVHAEQLEERERKHREELSHVIAWGLQRISATISEAVGAQTVAVLAPFLDEALTEAALRDISSLLKEAIIEGDVGAVTVRGPGLLFDRLRAKMDGHDDLIRHIEADDLDLAVDIDDTALVTRISAWTASLKKVLA
ncbi:MAG TPA: hypothetical protein DDW73_19225 [Rhizobium sp.]|nr:hypothetical protein [Rhizobium sp.]